MELYTSGDKCYAEHLNSNTRGKSSPSDPQFLATGPHFGYHLRPLAFTCIHLGWWHLLSLGTAGQINQWFTGD